MTPAIRAAKAAKIEFALHRYEPDPKADSYGLDAAAQLGIAPERIFKTLVAQIDGKKLVLAMVPVADRLDLKKMATIAGGKKAELAEPATAERATGYIVGGISPLGGRKRLPTLIDQTALGQPTIFMSAGQRGLQLELAPQDLIRLTTAELAELTASSH